MTDEQIEQAGIPVQLPESVTVAFNGFSHVYPAGTIFYPNDLLAIRMLQQNLGRRPVVWSITAGRSFEGLQDRAVQRGLGFAISPEKPDSTSPDYASAVIGPWLVDVPTTDSLAWHTYRYARLLEGDPPVLDPSVAVQARALSYPFTVLGFAYAGRSESQRALTNLDRAARLSGDPAVRAAYNQLRDELFRSEPQDSLKH
jgi:hypothetical protein